MATPTKRLAVERNQTTGNRLPLLSTSLDSIRTYQFEIQFWFPDGVSPSTKAQQLTVAAKKVSATGPKVEPIEVHRLNDRFFYPGKSNMDELVVTFDNLLTSQAGANLFAWFRTCAYDPLTGYQSPIANGTTDRKSFKAEKARLIQYDGAMTPIAYVDFIGVWPFAVKMSEFNYSQNEFHTLEVSFRYDLIDMFASTTSTSVDLVAGIFPST